MCLGMVRTSFRIFCANLVQFSAMQLRVDDGLYPADKIQLGVRPCSVVVSFAQSKMDRLLDGHRQHCSQRRVAESTEEDRRGRED